MEDWLIQKGLVPKTIRKHLNNANLYINNYLNYYEASTMKDDVHSVYGFLGGWFIEKWWSSKNSIKDTVASIKKFYECMSEKGYVTNEDYKALCKEIKENMNCFLELMDK